MGIQEDRQQKADALKKKLNIDKKRDEEPFRQDHPLVEAYRILSEELNKLSDVNNDAFTRLDKGKFKDLFIDETEIFAKAICFAENPFPNLDKRLKEHGIFRTIKKHSKVCIDGEDQDVETEEQEEITHTVKPLFDFAKEWMRKRHPTNGLRIDEFIKLAMAARGGEFLQRSSAPPQQTDSLNGRRLV
jgi:hypothetical protein